MRTNKTVHIGVVAGEQSGDIIGASVIEALRMRIPNLRCSGVGGSQMAKAGLEVLAPGSELSVLGFWEPIKRLPRLLRLRRQLRRYFIEQRVNLFLGIDAPDFNLSLERNLRSRGISTVHCVSPSVWAWRSWRIAKIRDSVNLMMTLFPFEAEFYKKHDVPTCCIGHPLADKLAPIKDYELLRTSLGAAKSGMLIAILPGSRSSEINKLGALFFRAAAECLRVRKDMNFIVAVADKRFRANLQAQFNQVVATYPNIGTRILFSEEPSWKIIAASDMVLTASGTATLEILLLDKPMVISYRLDPLTYRLVMWLSTVTNYGLPNLLAGETLVPEVIQAEATPENLAQAVLEQVNQTGAERTLLLKKYARIRKALKQDAATKAAEHLCRVLGYTG